jgi:transposase-like protein
MKLRPQQHQALRLWFKDARWTYNCALRHMMQNQWHKPTCTMPTNEMEALLVRRFVSVAGLQGRALLRTRTPKVIRQQAVKSILSSIKMIRTKRLKDPQAVFCPAFKDGLHDSIRIESRSIRRLAPRTCSIFRNWTPVLPEKVIALALGPGFLRARAYIFRSIELGDDVRDTDMQTDFSIHFKQGRFTLQLPRTVVVGTRPSVPSPSRVVAIDPGVRRFATTYSPEGSATIYGHNTSQVLDRLSRRIDRTKTTMARSVQKHQESKGQSRKQKGARRTRLRRSKRRYYSALRKAKDVIKDFHYKVSHDLLTRHDTIICPTTSSHRWRQGSSLRSIVKRRIQLLSFGSFARRLVQCATLYKNKTIVRGSEAYTSKQCGRCGTLQNKLGSSTTFSCGQCALVSDRDVHAARNILLRFIE